MFEKLKVKEVKQETADTVSIAFELPVELQSKFTYQSGQYITLKKVLNGEEIRRAYSISSVPTENDFRIAVKKVENGKMSSFLNENLKVGDVLEVMPPTGNFVIDNLQGNIVGFAAGSGITPIISMVKSVLNAGGTFTLFYGNKTAKDVIFKEELDKLQIKYPEKFNLTYIYSRENSANELLNGRIDKEKCKTLINKNNTLLKADGFYSCGPESMVNNIKAGLNELNIADDKIYFELFTTTQNTDEKKSFKNTFVGNSAVTVIIDDDEFDFNLQGNGDFILDAAIENGADVPFACKGAVCCTCKAQVIAGKAVMEMNYSLSDAEVAEGYILTCQSHPASEKLVVDYDVT